jgi:hypothetical protein
MVCVLENSSQEKTAHITTPAQQVWDGRRCPVLLYFITEKHLTLSFVGIGLTTHLAVCVPCKKEVHRYEIE